MSVKHALLALLERGPRHGYGLKHEFEARLGQAWPLNVGQVYTTLARLERDGLVAPEPQAGDDGERRAFRITGAGRAALAEWLSAPVPRELLARDELRVKVVAALEEGAEATIAVIRDRINGGGRGALGGGVFAPGPRELLARDELLVKVVAALEEGAEATIAVI